MSTYVDQGQSLMSVDAGFPDLCALPDGGIGGDATHVLGAKPGLAGEGGLDSVCGAGMRLLGCIRGCA